MAHWTGITTVTGSAGADTIQGTAATYALDNTIANKGSSGPVNWTSFENLTDSAAGTFNGSAGSSISGALTSLNGATLNGQITAGSATLGPVTLGSDVVLATSGNATFNSTIVGGQKLSVTSAGTTTLGGSVGTVATPLSDLTINTGGDLTLNVIHALKADLTAVGNILKAHRGDATPQLFIADSLSLTSKTGSVGGDATTNLKNATSAYADGIVLGSVPTATALDVSPNGHVILDVANETMFNSLFTSVTGHLKNGAMNTLQSLGCITSGSRCLSLFDKTAQAVGGAVGATILAAAQEELLKSLNSTDNVGAAISNGWVTTIGVVPPGIDAIEGEGVKPPAETINSLDDLCPEPAVGGQDCKRKPSR